MGIHDRDYYRDDKRSLFSSITERGKVCKWLILVNVVCFLLQVSTFYRPTDTTIVHEGREYNLTGVQVSLVTELFSLKVDSVLHGQVWRLLTYAFLHSEYDLLHLLFNMLFLWWFGTDLEDLYGGREFLAVYLSAALLGGIAYTAGVTFHLSHGGTCVGASGAVMAVLVLCAMHYPSRLIMMFMFLPVPIWLFSLFLVAKDLLGLVTKSAGHVAVTVHLAGAAFAYVYYRQQLRLGHWLPPWRRATSRRVKPSLRIYHEEDEEPTILPTSNKPEVDEQLEARVDAVLEKVAQFGQESLTEAEKQLLLQASEIYRKRKP